MRIVEVSVAAILWSSASGCASTYHPVNSPRLSVVMDGGGISYVRDGKRFEGGLFGGELDKAVQGNSRAEEYASSFKTGMITGFALGLVGAGTAIVGASVFGADAANHPGGQSVPPTGLVILGAGLLIDIIGGAIELGALPNFYDAINAYNDSVLPSSSPAAAGR